jgi:hypothetical protein
MCMCVCICTVTNREIEAVEYIHALACTALAPAPGAIGHPQTQEIRPEHFQKNPQPMSATAID